MFGGTSSLEDILVSTVGWNGEAEVPPKDPKLKNNASYWFGKGSSSDPKISMERPAGETASKSE